MNSTRIAPRLIALASAAFFTVLMLGAIDNLATSQPDAGLLAQRAAAPKA